MRGTCTCGEGRVPVERDVLGANGGVKAGALRVILHAVPEGEVGAASGVVVDVDVVGVGDPECGGSNVVVAETRRRFDKHTQVVLEGVVGLYAILQEKRSAHDVVQDL